QNLGFHIVAGGAGRPVVSTPQHVLFAPAGQVNEQVSGRSVSLSLGAQCKTRVWSQNSKCKTHLLLQTAANLLLVCNNHLLLSKNKKESATFVILHHAMELYSHIFITMYKK
ncbi:hypothetical protein ILYODFUR_027747, partial [Ilyodon furcidens]